MQIKELTGNPTTILRSEILFNPACKLTFPVKVNLWYCKLPKAEPSIISHHPHLDIKRIFLSHRLRKLLTCFQIMSSW